MKIAVCLRGHMRTFDKSYGYINDLKKDHDVDVFIHTWEDLGYFKLHVPNFTANNEGTIKLNSGEIDIDRIKEIYNPNEIVVEQYESMRDIFEDMASKFLPWFEQIKHDPTVGQPRMHSFMSQLYKEQEVIKMKTQYAKNNNKKYDLVIVTRPDIYIETNNESLNKMLENKDAVYVRSTDGSVDEIYKSVWICNSYFISSDENINKIGTLFSKINEIRENLYNIWKTTGDVSTYSIMFCIHRLCWYHLKTNNLSPLIGVNSIIVR